MLTNINFFANCVLYSTGFSAVVAEVNSVSGVICNICALWTGFVCSTSENDRSKHHRTRNNNNLTCACGCQAPSPKVSSDKSNCSRGYTVNQCLCITRLCSPSELLATSANTYVAGSFSFYHQLTCIHPKRDRQKTSCSLSPDGWFQNSSWAHPCATVILSPMVYAAGLEYLMTNDPDWKPAKLLPADWKEQNLKNQCRKVTRKHLLTLDPHTNLFVRVHQLKRRHDRPGLPEKLVSYLLFEQSVEVDQEELEEWVREQKRLEEESYRRALEMEWYLTRDEPRYPTRRYQAN